MKTLTLQVRLGGVLLQTQSLTQDVIKIGKLRSSHLWLDDDAVGRMHAVIEVSGGDVRLIDLGTANGTLHNGARVDRNASLSGGDRLEFGPYEITVVEIAETRSPGVTAASRLPMGASPAPTVAIDAASVEVHDGRQVAEVVAMYGRTPIDVAHVGQVVTRKAIGPALVVGGVLMVAGGLGLFASEITQDWQTYSQEVRDAQQAKRAEPTRPGNGTGGLGLGIALLGLFPLIAGGLRSSARTITDYTIGEGHDAVLHVPPAGLPDPVAFPLVRSQGGEFTLNFTAAMQGEITLDGRTTDLAELIASGRAASVGSYYTVPLPLGARGRVVHGEVGFHINTVNPGAIVAGRGTTDWPFWAYVGGTASIGFAFYFLMRSIPDQLLGLAIDDDGSAPAYARYMHQPDEQNPEEMPPEPTEVSDDQAGGTGQRHAGEEGKMGKPTSKSKSGLYTMKGPKTAIPQMSRTFDPDMAARNAGILGVMQEQGGHFLASPYGGAFAVGNDDADIWGGLTGTIGAEAYGVGGLGLIGSGRGGGGTGQGTIGMGDVGFIGKGGGGGTGTGYGTGAGTGFGGTIKRHMVVKPGPIVTIQGALDRDIIRRIVRAHINEVRSCYNAGLTKDPNLQGRVAIAFVIGGTGKVTSSVLQETSVKDPSVGNCVAKAVRRWAFPKPRGGGNVLVTYPFNLSAG